MYNKEINNMVSFLSHLFQWCIEKKKKTTVFAKCKNAQSKNHQSIVAVKRHTSVHITSSSLQDSPIKSQVPL